LRVLESNMNQRDIKNIREDLDRIESKYQVLGSAMNNPKYSWNFYSIEDLKDILKEVDSFHKADLQKAQSWANIELNRISTPGSFGIDQLNFGWHDLIYKTNKVLMIKEYLPELIKKRERDRDEVLEDIKDVRELVAKSYESDSDPLVRLSLERLTKKITRLKPVFKDVTEEMSELKRDLERAQEFLPKVKNKLRKWFRLADQQASIRVASRHLKK
jgi:hypothetical protein